jgi:hypothetical protein
LQARKRRDHHHTIDNNNNYNTVESDAVQHIEQLRRMSQQHNEQLCVVRH